MENEQNDQIGGGNKPDLTIKEQRELKHQQKVQKRSAFEEQARKESWYRAGLWTFVVVVLLAAVFAIVKLVNSGTIGAGSPTDIMASVTASDWQRDDLTASSTLIEYGDFQCPACEAYYPLTKQIDAMFGKQLRFIFREFPLPQHANATIAAQAAEAAGDQGQDKFWLMHDLLYQDQANWADLSTADATAMFVTYAQQIGLNIPQFNTDFASSATAAKIQASINEGVKFGVDATPTFYLNGVQLQPATSAAEFYATIQQGIEAASGSTTNATSTTGN